MDTKDMNIDLVTGKQEDETSLLKREEPERIKMDIPVLKAPKIVGKIDLDAINARSKPSKKTREERLKEKEERKQIALKRKEAWKQVCIEQGMIKEVKEKGRKKTKIQTEQELLSLQKTEQPKNENKNRGLNFFKSLIKKTFLAKYFS